MTYFNLLIPCLCQDKKSDGNQNFPTETGFDRLKRMYQKDDACQMSPELFYLINTASATVVTSAFFGALISSAKAKHDYLRKNVASTYESDYLARRHLVDNMTLSAIRGGLKYALKFGSFSSLYLLSTMSAANYSNKITIWQHIGTGALLGGIARINFGLKGMAVAGGLGAVLGTFTGGILTLFLWLNNITLDDLRNWQADSYYAKKKERSRKNMSNDRFWISREN